MIIVISLVIGYNYSAEQTRLKGFNFGNYLQAIQEDLKKIETNFQSEIAIFQEGDSSTEEFSEYSNLHISKMEELILRYDFFSFPCKKLPSFRFKSYSRFFFERAKSHLYVLSII